MENLEARVMKLEAENLIARELIRALIARTKPDPLRDAPFTVAIQAFNGTVRGLPPESRQVYAQALQSLDPYSIPRARI